MSKAEIIEALPKLTAEERSKTQTLLDELAGEGWLDGGELTSQARQLLGKSPE